MHDFGHTLDDARMERLADIVMQFSTQAGDRVRYGVPIEAPSPPANATSMIATGRELYAKYGCVQCHGSAGKGDGAAAATLRDAAGLPDPPYDLTAQPLRRPRPNAYDPDRDDGVAAIYLSLVTGLAGTPMPSYAALPKSDLWAISAYIESIRVKPRGAPKNNSSEIPKMAISRDRTVRRTAMGYWLGDASGDEARVWGKTLAMQGQSGAHLALAQSSLAPAQSSLDARQCARCHNKQYREWQGSLHGLAASPGTMAQLVRGAGDEFVEGCQRCHAPLAEQLPRHREAHRGGPEESRRYRSNAQFKPLLRKQGINCAACHVRDWQRLGPPLVEESKLLSLSNYPRKELAIYERSDFCYACHQHTARMGMNQKPLLNTYKEWLEGPYMRRGVQCQHCHMPNREHTWKGVHDPDTFRQGIRVDVISARSKKTGAVSVRARIVNVGAGHYLPTTPTPAAWLKIQLLDHDGDPVRGATAEKRIGRHIAFKNGKFIDIEDTRIPPGESVELAAAWRKGRVDDAVAVKVTVRVEPDNYYEGLYRQRLRRKLAPKVRALFQEALRNAQKSGYVAYENSVPIR